MRCEATVIHFLAMFLLQKATSYNLTARTFTEHGESFLSFHPSLSSSQNQSWILSFRTDKANALLLYHSLDRYNRRNFPLLHDYGMYAEVKHARLVVTYLMNEYKDEFVRDDFLNDDSWHTITLSLYPQQNELSIDVDNRTTKHNLKSYRWGNAATILDWSNLPSTVSYGGTERAIPFGYETLIGCMRALQYLTYAGQFEEVVEERSAHVHPGCKDLCEADNPCRSQGRCINRYSKTECDCSGTGHDGPQCQIAGPIRMTLHGYEWLIHKLYVDPDNKVNSRRNHFSIDFKTQRPTGVLVYSVGATPYHSHLVVTLYGGSVHVSLSFGGEDLEISLGIGLDNNRWHSLSIDHDVRNVKVTLDQVIRRRRITGPVTFLNLDADVHIGGGSSFVVTRVWKTRKSPGLKVTQNFAGCIRNVFINGISALFSQQIGNTHRTKFYGSTPVYRCERLINVPLSFPNSASMLLIDTPSTQQVTVAMEVRTYTSDAIVLSVDLGVGERFRGYDSGGFVELWISDGEMLVHFVPSSHQTQHTQDLVVPLTVNDGIWHSLVFTLIKSQVTLTVDKMTVRSLTYVDDLYIHGSIAIGYGLRIYKSGYIGCMRKINIQGRDLDPIDVVQTSAAVGVVLDGCPLVNRCGGVSVCEHGSLCVSDWYGTKCDCSRVPYTGKTCHFAMFQRSCDEIYQSGWRESGVYQIDPDGNGPLPASHVRCHMSYRRGDELYGVTQVEHNLGVNTTVREPGLPHIRKMISYRFMDKWQLAALTKHSTHCTQHISFQCYKAPLRLGEKTLMSGVNGAHLNYIGVPDPGYCHCYMDRSCADMQSCNCDAGEDAWVTDEGNMTTMKELPITDMVFMQQGRGVSRVNLGPLKCWGSDHMTRELPVTFKSRAAYVIAPGWTTGDLSLTFRTTLTDAVLLHQRSQSSYFILQIISPKEVLFEFGSSLKSLRYIVGSKTPVNNGEWVVVRVEHDDYNVRLTVNTERKMFDLGEARIGGYTGEMYVGAAHTGTDEGGVRDKTGFLGCIRGVFYNRLNIHLIDYINNEEGLVAEGCAASCQVMPCQNGASCRERWNGYICECVNTWSHLGNNCEKNLDEDVISLNGSHQTFLIFVEKIHLTLLEETLLLSFRTHLSNTQLFYGYDHLNNFIQLEVQGGRDLIVRFNTYSTIIEESLRIDGLSDGEWKQVLVEQGVDGTITLRCGLQEKTVQARRVPLTEYSIQPFLYLESIRPVRTNRPRDKSVFLYVGGVDPSMKTSRTYPNLVGCVRGVRIGQTTLHLAPAAYSYRGVREGCEPGCERNVCPNKGKCNEKWFGKYSCDCSQSYYSGPRCTIEPSALFIGHSAVKLAIDLTPYPDLQHTVSERISFHFKTDNHFSHNAVLILIYSEVTKHYIVAYISPAGTLVVETNIFEAVYIVKNVANYSDGESHYVEYERNKSNVKLTVSPHPPTSYMASFSYKYSMDYSRVARMIYPEYQLDQIDAIMVGGFHLQQPDPRLADYTNFTGCITDVKFYLGPQRKIVFKPLEAFHSIPTHPNVTILGDAVLPCNTATVIPDPHISSSVPTTPLYINVVTMPLWDMKPANTVVIGHPNTTTTASVLPNITLPNPPSLSEHDSDDVAIVLAVVLVSFFMVIAIIITIFIMCLRRRDDKKKKVKTEPQDYIELTKPERVVEKCPTVHLASLDEFSLISGSSPDDGPPFAGFQSCTYRFVEPITEDSSWLNPPINHKKHRPASSISEVLEEMDRRRKAKEFGIDPSEFFVDPNSERSKSQTGSRYGMTLDWDTMQKPSSCNNLGEAMTTTDVCVHGEPHFNGDSGYEADSTKRTDSEHLQSSKSPTQLKQLGENMSSFDSDVSSDASLISETEHDRIHSVESLSDLSVVDEVRRPQDEFNDRIVIIEATPPDSNVTTPSSVKELPYCAKNSRDHKDSPDHKYSPKHNSTNQT